MMYNYKEVGRKEMTYFSLNELNEWLKEIVPSGTKDEDVLIEIEKEQYTGYYDDVITDIYVAVSVREEVQPKKKKKE